ncbi:MAG: FAD:protein FMN transferase [Acidimicrobiia bacterium]|nr:FAD:protein FMN transferase [Acidimicrobiia bacterium]
MFGGEATVAVTEPGALTEAQWIVQDELDVVDKACSRFRADSELVALNGAAGRPVRVSAALSQAVSVALRGAALTDGDVDPTVGEAVRILGYDRDFAAVGASGRAGVRIARIPGWRCVSVGEDSSVRMPAGVQLDLGATAKAWAADIAAARAASVLGCGVLVSLGGDVSVAGPAPRSGWNVGLADWHGAADPDVAAMVTIDSGGVATSSTSVRRWRRGADTVHHIVDPRTGRSAESPWRTVTVAAGSCVDANIASTAAMVRGARAPDWLIKRCLPARLVAVSGEVVSVGGWPGESAT